MTATQQKDAVDVLLAQHEQIKALFGQVMSASGEEKRERFEDLVRLLAVHEAPVGPPCSATLTAVIVPDPAWHAGVRMPATDVARSEGFVP